MDLRELRKRANLRIIDVAYQLDVSETSVRNWEKGRSPIRVRLEMVALLCRLYDCSIEELNQAMQESLAKAATKPEAEDED